MRTFNIGETVVVPRFVRGAVVGHATGTVADHYPSTDSASTFYLVRVQDGDRMRHVGHYPHEMTRPGEPRHLDTSVSADTGTSSDHHQPVIPMPSPTYTDAWAGNPDTDKFWAK